MPKTNIRTTITLPQQLLDAVDQAVLEGKAKSRNELLATALRHELDALERAAIDAAFADMANDLDYQEEARRISDDFTHADWSAFRQAEKSH
jgi:metal-responsive CopG/Arc/MetJ family transcriptional regulator